MLYKQSAIAVMIAVMLGVASIFGGLSTIPAFATHDPDAVELAREQVTQDDDESVVIDAVELDARKVISRASGTLTVEIIQGNDVLESASVGTGALKTSFTTIEVDVTNVNVTGSFEILVEYEGSYEVMVSGIDIVEGTDVAEVPEEPTDSGNGEPTAPEEPDALENVIASRTIAQDDDETTTVDAVEFDAKKATSRTSGTLTVALVQNDAILAQQTFNTGNLKTSYTEKEAAFDEEITGEFDVVFMYEGSGRIMIASFNVVGPTEPAEDDDTDGGDGVSELTIKTVDQNGAALTELLWVVVNNGDTEGGWAPETFELTNGPYTIATDDYFDSGSGTMYTFVQWTDGVTTKSRPVDLNGDKMFTAEFNVAGNSPPPPDDDNNPPPDDNNNPPPDNNPPPGPGSLTVFAHRIPSEHWGTSTFTSANAAMWFVLYNSTGWLVTSDFYDENGTTVTGLNDGETYYIYATDCDECHGSTHDVVFDHWEDNGTNNPRGVTTGTNSHAYYAYDPDA